MHLLLKVDTSKLADKAKQDAADRAIEVIRNRIDQFGVRETSIQRQGDDGSSFSCRVTDRQRAIDVIGKTALLEFKLVSQDQDKIKAAREGQVPEGFEWKPLQDEPRRACYWKARRFSPAIRLPMRRWVSVPAVSVSL
jgi:preprotein translocase subunit SecD